jgi:hypothetical protein
MTEISSQGTRDAAVYKWQGLLEETCLRLDRGRGQGRADRGTGWFVDAQQGHASAGGPSSDLADIVDESFQARVVARVIVELEDD